MITSPKTNNEVDETILKNIQIKPKKSYSAKLNKNVMQSYEIDCNIDDSGDIKIFVETKFNHLKGIDGKIDTFARVYLKDNKDIITIMEEALKTRPINIHNSPSFQRIKDSIAESEAIKDLFLFSEDEIMLTGLGVSLESETKEIVSFSRTMITKQKNTVSSRLEDSIVFKQSSVNNKSNIVYFYSEYHQAIFEIKDTGVLSVLNDDIDYDLKDILDNIKNFSLEEARQYLFNNFVEEISIDNKRKNIANSFNDIDLF